jgi:hypothetical protein
MEFLKKWNFWKGVWSIKKKLLHRKANSKINWTRGGGRTYTYCLQCNMSLEVQESVHSDQQDARIMVPHHCQHVKTCCRLCHVSGCPSLASHKRSIFRPRPIHMGFMMNKVASWHIFPQVLQFSPLSFHQCSILINWSINSATDKVVS